MATMDDLAQTVLTAVTGKDVRNAMAQAISQWDSAKGDIFERLEAVEAKANQASQDVDNLRNHIDEVNQRKATHDDVEELRQSLQQRINHLYAGDPSTIKTVVEEILEEKGVI